MLDLLGLGGDEESDGGSSITTTTTTANPSPTGDESGEEMNPGFRGWIKRGEKDKREEADDEGEDEEKNWALRGFKKVLIKRQEGDSTYGEEENMGPYRGYKL